MSRASSRTFSNAIVVTSVYPFRCQVPTHVLNPGRRPSEQAVGISPPGSIDGMGSIFHLAEFPPVANYSLRAQQ